jgi:hypothetical protein
MKKDQPEHRLSAYVDTLLERIVTQPAWFTAVETGTVMVNKSPQARMNEAAKRKKRGIKPFHLDWMIYQRPNYAQFELKVGHNKTTDGQDTTIRMLHERGISAGVCQSVFDVWVFLHAARFDLHGNAENIARELEATWRAAQDTADVKKTLPTKVYKPRAERPSRAAVARGNAQSLLGRG